MFTQYTVFILPTLLIMYALCKFLLSLRIVGVVCAIFTTVRAVNSSVRTFLRCVLTEISVCPKFLMDRQFFDHLSERSNDLGSSVAYGICSKNWHVTFMVHLEIFLEDYDVTAFRF